ncbi:hypothetical protein ACFVZH_16780 [Streptomyces sp. NPDC059534]|uniref:hypothetical protein n=1 Tax=Streptomyces sp. NPDC059534 TaxID=3346859 RepID=UPI0036B9960D
MKRRIRSSLLATTLITGLAGLTTVTVAQVAGGTGAHDTGWGAGVLSGTYGIDGTGRGAPVAGPGTNDTGWG